MKRETHWVMLKVIRQAALGRILFLPHAVQQMSRPDRMISAGDVKRVIRMGRIIEDYPEDKRGHSCLVEGKTADGRLIHVVCAPKTDYLAIITAYLPRSGWTNSRSESRRQP